MSETGSTSTDERPVQGTEPVDKDVSLSSISDDYRANVPDDLIPYWDLEDPSIPDAPRDTSAAALAAYGLVRLSSDSRLRTAGEEILASLIESYTITDADDPRRGMVRHGCYDKPGEYATDNELIWTNYYVAYALYSLSDQS